MVRERRYKRSTSFLMNTDYDVLEDFRKLCSNERKDVSEKLNELIREELQKNVVGVGTPINIPYSNDINQSGKKDYSISLCFDKFLGIDEIKPMVNQIPIESLSKAFSNSRRLYQQLQFKTEGKITVQ